jgi:hypothetical protein
MHLENGYRLGESFEIERPHGIEAIVWVGRSFRPHEFSSLTLKGGGPLGPIAGYIDSQIKRTPEKPWETRLQAVPPRSDSQPKSLG